MPPLGERLAKIETNTEHLVVKVEAIDDRLCTVLDKHETRLGEQEKTVARHTVYWWLVGIGGSVLLAWLTGLGDILIEKALAFLE